MKGEEIKLIIAVTVDCVVLFTDTFSVKRRINGR